MSMAYGPKTFRDAVGGVRMAKPTTDGYKTVTGKRSKAARASAGARASTAAWTAYPSPAVAPSKGSSPSPPATNKFKAGRLQPPITHAKPMATTRNVNVKAGPLKATNTGRTHTAGQESPQPPTVTLADFVQHAPRRSASARALRKRASGSPGGASPSPSPAAAAVTATPVKAPSWAAAARAPPAVSASSPRPAKPAPKTSKTMRSSSQGVKAFKLSSATDFPSLRG